LTKQTQEACILDFMRTPMSCRVLIDLMITGPSETMWTEVKIPTLTSQKARR
jgi:hypothetical protein